MCINTIILCFIIKITQLGNWAAGNCMVCDTVAARHRNSRPPPPTPRLKHSTTKRDQQLQLPASSATVMLTVLTAFAGLFLLMAWCYQVSGGAPPFSINGQKNLAGMRDGPGVLDEEMWASSVPSLPAKVPTVAARARSGENYKSTSNKLSAFPFQLPMTTPKQADVGRSVPPFTLFKMAFVQPHRPMTTKHADLGCSFPLQSYFAYVYGIQPYWEEAIFQVSEPERKN